MTSIVALGPSWLDANTILNELGSYALYGVLLIIFAECGLLIGFFMPGDSLLFVTGMFIARGNIHHNIVLVAVVLAIAAIAGNLVGYFIGYKAGPAIFNRPDSRLFKRSHVEKTHAFFERYGARAILLARFVPIVRTFITVVAGVARMPFRHYALYSSIGGVIWASGVTVLGYFLGQIDFIRDNIEVILVLVVLISVVPIGIELLRARLSSRRERAAARVSEPPAS